MPEPILTATIQARYDFTQEERNALADQLTASMGEQDQIEAEFESVKASFKSRLANVQNKTIETARKLRDKFEMRETLAIVVMDAPQPGRKSYHFAHKNGDGTFHLGAFIRDDLMSYEDKQRKLPLEEPAPTNEALADSFDAAEAPQSKDTLPEGFALVTEGVSEEGDKAWDAEVCRWEPVTDPGFGASAYTALARPINAAPAAEPAPENPAAGMTPFGQALNAVAAGKETPLVPVVLSPTYPPEKNRDLFLKAAKREKWPQPCLDLIKEQAGNIIDPANADESNVKLLALLTPHCVEGAK